MTKWVIGGAVVLVSSLGALALFPLLEMPPASAAGPLGSLDPVPPSLGSSAGNSVGNARLDRPARREGATAQALAQERFDALVKTIRNFEGSDVNPIGIYYTVPRYSGYPGLCAAEAFSIDLRERPALRARTVYRLVGSTDAPKSGFDPAQNIALNEYTTRATANCAARIASFDWFEGENAQHSWNAVHLYDGLIAAARARRPLIFELRCAGFEPGSAVCANPRSTLAALDPRDIVTLTIESHVQEGALRRLTLIRPHHGKFSIHIQELVLNGLGSATNVTPIAVEVRAIVPNIIDFPGPNPRDSQWRSSTAQ